MNFKRITYIGGCVLAVATTTIAAGPHGRIRQLGADAGHGKSVHAVAYQNLTQQADLFENPFVDDVPPNVPRQAPAANPVQMVAPPSPAQAVSPPLPTPMQGYVSPAPSAAPTYRAPAMSVPAPETMEIPTQTYAPTLAPTPSYAVGPESSYIPTSGTGAACGPCAPLTPAPICSAAGGCDGSCDGGCDSNGGCGTGFGLCDCNLGDAFTLNELLFGDCPPCISVGGWFSTGYHSESNDLFNSRPDELSLHQAWLYLEKTAGEGSPFGFRADIMYGIDAGDTQAFGNPAGTWDFDNGLDHGAYGWAIPQLYGTMALGDWTLQAGHFYTLIGYEVVTAPDNFFYSHAITMYNSEPFTHTGVMLSGPVGENITAYAGWTLGWDTGFEELNNGSSWLGGVSLTLTDDASLTYMSTGGNFGARGDDAYSHSVVLDLAMTEKLNWVLQSDLVRVDSTGEDNVGLNQYFIYNISDCLGLGARAEWWKGDVLTGYAPHGGSLPDAGSLSYYAATFGANIKPHANFTIRPEVRVDWSPAADYDETYYGVDAYFTF